MAKKKEETSESIKDVESLEPVAGFAATVSEEVKAEVQEKFIESLVDFRNKVYNFALQHRETPSGTGRTVGNMILEFLEKN